MNLTSEQTDFINALVMGTGGLALQARAGTGKTSTILAGVDAILNLRPDAEIFVCAFNKSIADEISGKLPKLKNVRAGTLHSMGFGMCRYFLNNPTVNSYKLHDLIDTMIDKDDWEADYRPMVVKLVSHAKLAGVGYFPELPMDSKNTWRDIVDHNDIDWPDDKEQQDRLYGLAWRLLTKSNAQTSVVDFDDMIYLPLLKNMNTRYKKDYLFIDEAQDLSPTRQELAFKFLRGRMVIVGDDRQAIYGFAGADAQSMFNLIKRTEAAIMPLTTSWRCPTSVIALANTLVPDIRAREGAPEGQIVYLKDGDFGEPKPGDAILCRNMAPLMTVAYKLLKRRIPVKVEGRAIGEGLIAAIKKEKAKDLDDLREKIAIRLEADLEKYKDRPGKSEAIADRMEAIRVLSHEVQTVDELITFIKSVFADGAVGTVVCATYHRAKGREWNKVTLIEHHLRCPSFYARRPDQLLQEDNLAYVAYTRAKDTLVFSGVVTEQGRRMQAAQRISNGA